MSTEYRELPALHKALWAIFDGVKNKSDIQQLRAVLMPRMVEDHGQMVDVNLEGSKNSWLMRWARDFRVVAC
ncbi:Type I restriction-modification system, restriction subunit R [Acetobacter malorum]|nr:Type I restriction-modification system, restriction subunit R [Acetobacter malorum]